MENINKVIGQLKLNDGLTRELAKLKDDRKLRSIGAKGQGPMTCHTQHKTVVFRRTS